MTTLAGIDIQSIADVERSFKEFGERYTERLFTRRELAACGPRRDCTAGTLAAAFAAKEAVLKVLDTREVVPPWRTIEVHRSDNYHPEIVLSGEAAALARRQGIQHWCLSLSLGGGFALAAVTALVSEVPGGAKS